MLACCCPAGTHGLPRSKIPVSRVRRPSDSGCRSRTRARHRTRTRLSSAAGVGDGWIVAPVARVRPPVRQRSLRRKTPRHEPTCPVAQGRAADRNHQPSQRSAIDPRKPPFRPIKTDIEPVSTSNPACSVLRTSLGFRPDRTRAWSGISNLQIPRRGLERVARGPPSVAARIQDDVFGGRTREGSIDLPQLILLVT